MKKTRLSLSGALKLEFQKDLELFKHFLLMVNNSGPIRNVELMWNEEDEELDPTKQRFKSRVGTEDALVQLQPAGSVGANRSSPSTLFCDMVHGFGAHEEETCARSDVPAKKRCQATGCAQIYSCHVGLTDIAVPVFCDAEYLGTLFSGQVLTHPPTREGFRLVKEALANQPHINFTSLEAAYYQVPVVDQTQVAEMVRILELFARYLSNSWKRLKIMSEYQRSHDRELALDRKEMASILLSGETGDRTELKTFAQRAGLSGLPDRVLVVQVTYQIPSHEKTEGASKRMSLSRISHFIEDQCQTLPNTLATVVCPGEICIFTGHEVRNAGHERISVHEMANGLLASITKQGGVGARIGISAAHSRPEELVRAYEEACVALHSNSSEVCFFNDPAHLSPQPVEVLERIVKQIDRGSDPSQAVREFLTQAIPSDHSSAHMPQSRAFLTWAIEHVALEIKSLGVETQPAELAKAQALSAVLNAPNPFSAGEAFRRFVGLLVQQVAYTYSQRQEKIVSAIYRLVEERGIALVKMRDFSELLHLSSGHISRVFHRTTGMTLEEYLIRKRVEEAKRMLLDPRWNVAEVAERSGFCNPAYFASVFKKYVKCTPRQYANRPHPIEPLAATPRLALGTHTHDVLQEEAIRNTMRCQAH